MVKIPSINKAGLQQLIDVSQRILLTTHQNPDGDGLGSEIAMFDHLIKLDKECRIINITKLPEKYLFLDNDYIVEQYKPEDDQWIDEVDLILIFDIGDSKRVGAMAQKIYNGKKVVSIDHHPVKQGEPYSFIWIDENAPATGFMVWEYLVNGKYKETLPISQALPLYVALITDTGSFRYSNTHAESHLMAYQLIRSGVKPQEVTKLVFENRHLNQVKLLGDAIKNLKFKFGNQVAWVIITKTTILALDIKKEHIEGYADFIRSIKDVEIAFVIIEEDNFIRISLRSQGKFTVNDIAKEVGGGGHRFASGAIMTKNNVEEVESIILNLLSKKFKAA